MPETRKYDCTNGLPFSSVLKKEKRKIVTKFTDLRSDIVPVSVLIIRLVLETMAFGKERKKQRQQSRSLL